MSLGTRLLNRSVLSLIDQVALSGLNFVIGILLIRWVSKDEYGLYTTLFSAGILASTLLDALVGTTITTLAGPLEGSDRQRLLARASICRPGPVWALGDSWAWAQAPGPGTTGCLYRN